MKTIIKNATVIMPDKVGRNHWLLIEDDEIKRIGTVAEAVPSHDNCLDAEEAVLMPGLIDIHSDMIEQILQPRSTALMDFSLSLAEADKQLAACGITTMFHSISMYQEGTWDVKEIRQAPQVKKLAELIKNMADKERLIRHKYHLRYEIDNLGCFDDVAAMISSGKVHLLSFMDHTPHQGQYKDLSIYRKHLPGEGKNLTDEEFAALIERELHKVKLSDDQLSKLANLAKAKRISIASHDDDSFDKLASNHQLGVKISEFPITMEVAQHACRMGFKTVLGAPNVLLGKSHSGNLSAAKAVAAGCGSILCSDYYPQALLRAIFKLSGELALPLHETCKLATLAPAQAAGIDAAYGSIEAGKKADFIIVKKNCDGEPQLLQTWVDGVCVMKFGYHVGKEA